MKGMKPQNNPSKVYIGKPVVLDKGKGALCRFLCCDKDGNMCKDTKERREPKSSNY
jgi:hypothetical protein